MYVRVALKGTRKAEHEERGASGTRLYGARIIKGKEPIRKVEKKNETRLVVEMSKGA